MANENSSGSVLMALQELQEQVLEASLWASISNDLAGEAKGAPEWPFLAMRHVQRIERAMELLSDRIYADRKGASE